MQQRIPHDIVDRRVQHLRITPIAHRIRRAHTQPIRRTLTLELSVVNDLPYQLRDIEIFEVKTSPDRVRAARTSRMCPMS